jgi:hypothetical protein
MSPLLALLIVGCSDPASDGKADGDTVGTDTAADTGEPFDLTTIAPLDISAEVSPDVVTVVRVRWRTDVESAGYVVFGEDDSYRLATPPTAVGLDHEVLLLGMTADTEVHFQVVSTVPAGDQRSDDQTITTGSLPPGLYPTRVVGEATAWSGYQVLPLQGSSYAVVIVDRWGHYVWYHLIEAERGNLMTAFLSVDGRSVIYCMAGPQDALEEGKIVRVSLWGDEVTDTPVPYLDHDMTELPDGTIAAIVVVAGGDDGTATADSLVEIAPDGTSTTVWNAWDEYDPVALHFPMDHNWTHANAIDYAPDEDAYYFSLKALESMVKIDRATGTVEWALGGRLNQFTFDGAALGLHHQFEVLDDGNMLFFENEREDRGYSQAVEFTVDQDARTAKEVWSYSHTPPLSVFAKGDVHRFADGTTQVVWSSAGEIQNVTAAGEVTWQLDLDIGQVITFVQVVDTLYRAN